MIKKYKINGKIAYQCDKNGLPLIQRKEKHRRTLNGENNFENKYRAMIKQTGFNIGESISNKWLCDIFSKSKSKYIEAKSIAMFFGALINDLPTREVYRRLSTLLFWLDQKIDMINDICKMYEIKVQISKKVVKIPPPFIDIESIIPKEEEIKFDLFPSNFEDVLINIFDTFQYKEE